MISRSHFRTFGGLLFAKALQLLGPLFLFPYLYQHLSKVSFGHYALIQSMNLFLISWAEFGTDLPNARNLSIVKSINEASEIFSNASFIKLSVVLLASGFVLLFSYFSLDIPLTTLVLGILGGAFWTLSPSWFFIGMGKAEVFAVLASILKISGILCIALIPKNLLDLHNVFLIEFLASFALFCLSHTYIFKKYVPTIERPKWPLLLRNLKTGSVVFGSKISIYIYTGFSLWILGRLKGPEAAGTYTSIIKVIELPGSLLLTIVQGYFAYFSLNWGKNPKETNNSLNQLICALTVLGVLWIGIMFFIGPNLFHFLYPELSKEQVLLIRFLPVATPFILISGSIAHLGIYPLGAYHKLFRALLVPAAISCCSAYYLIRYAGVIGLAVNSVFIEVVACASLLMAFRSIQSKCSVVRL